MNARNRFRAMAGGIVVTFGLLLMILGCLARTPTVVPYAVGLYITSADWFRHRLLSPIQL